MNNIIARYNISQNDTANNGGSLYLFNEDSQLFGNNLKIPNSYELITILLLKTMYYDFELYWRKGLLRKYPAAGSEPRHMRT